MKLTKNLRLPSGTIIPAGTELHFSTEGKGYYKAEEVFEQAVPDEAIESETAPLAQSGTTMEPGEVNQTDITKSIAGQRNHSMMLSLSKLDAERLQHALDDANIQVMPIKMQGNNVQIVAKPNDIQKIYKIASKLNVTILTEDALRTQTY